MVLTCFTYRDTKRFRKSIQITCSRFVVYVNDHSTRAESQTTHSHVDTMSNEQWRPTFGEYLVSNQGRVKSFHNDNDGRIIMGSESGKKLRFSSSTSLMYSPQVSSGQVVPSLRDSLSIRSPAGSFRVLESQPHVDWEVSPGTNQSSEQCFYVHLQSPVVGGVT